MHKKYCFVCLGQFFPYTAQTKWNNCLLKTPCYIQNGIASGLVIKELLHFTEMLEQLYF